jgi:hypothetical protein
MKYVKSSYTNNGTLAVLAYYDNGSLYGGVSLVGLVFGEADWQVQDAKEDRR